MSLEDRYNELPDDVKKKAAACTSADELLKLAEGVGIKLSDDELEAISGGTWGNSDHWASCTNLAQNS